MSQQPEQAEAFKVVVNHEEQYSIWPQERAIPAGWRDAGKHGSREDCLAWIERNWTDMRPLSVRRQEATASQDSPTPSSG